MASMKKLLALLLAVVMVFSLVACGGKTEDQTPADNNQQTNQPEAPADSDSNEPQPSETEDRTLIIATNAEMTTTDPQMLNSSAVTSILNNVFSRLVDTATDGELVMDLATDYELLEDKLTWRFHLRDDAVFHDGTPVTADDVVFSLTRVMTDETGSDFTNFQPLKEVKAVDEHTVDIVSKDSYPIMLNLLAKGGASILPKAYFEEVGLDGFIAKPIGSGPYMLKEYIKDDHTTLIPFEDYYGGGNDEWDEVIFRFITESSTRVGELIAGNVDIINQVIPAEWDRVNNNEGSSIVTGPSTRIYQLALKCDRGYTVDKRVRQAIDYAINDQLIVDTILKGSGRPMLTRIPGGVSGVNDDLVGAYNYDLEKAKALMKEAGLEDGFKLHITGMAGLQMMDSEICQAITAMLKDINIECELELLDRPAYTQVWSARNAPDALMTCFGMGFFDASYGMIGYIGGNTEGESNWEDQEYIDLYNKAEYNMNLEERDAQMKELQEIVAEETPYVIIAQLYSNYGVQDDIEFVGRLDEVWDIRSIHRK